MFKLFKRCKERRRICDCFPCFKTEYQRVGEETYDYGYENLPIYGLHGKEFYCKVLEVYDGENITITYQTNESLSAEAHNGYTRLACRLEGIGTPSITSNDACERRAAIMSRNHLFFLLTNSTIREVSTRHDMRRIFKESQTIVRVRCAGYDPRGKVFITLYAPPSTTTAGYGGKTINQQMMDDGYAELYTWCGARKICWAEPGRFLTLKAVCEEDAQPPPLLLGSITKKKTAPTHQTSTIPLAAPQSDSEADGDCEISP